VHYFSLLCLCSVKTAAAPAASAVATALAAAVAGAAGGSISCSLVKGPLTAWAAANGLAAEPRAAFMFEGLDQLLPLLVGGWLAVMLISAVASRARKVSSRRAPKQWPAVGKAVGSLAAPSSHITAGAVSGHGTIGFKHPATMNLC
jgi:hypothetical protein